MGFSSQECWSGLPFPTPGDLLDSGIEPASLMSPALAGGFFTPSATWESAICICISLPSWTSVPLRPPSHPIYLGNHRAQTELPVSYIRVLLAVCFTHGSVYMSILISQFHPPSPPPALCPRVHYVHSLRLCLYSCPANRFICIIFQDSTYVLIYDVCFSDFQQE